MEQDITITNTDLREQGADYIVYEGGDFSRPDIARALVEERLDGLSELDFDGYFQGSMWLAAKETAQGYIYYGAAGKSAHLYYSQAIALISAHEGKITVHL